ncbi:AI-2E family transporter [Xanthobacteraceae bacterium Astr-EGSB]|uniref:AI-2E family transporter n=1 Tax=Astrobacterium formosum TaxID=3069710 RepID=UPI0027B805E9|nr:AI-2E family transporter [Xanthobacteraceae bacterium Astr-EGSB]
MSQHGHDHSTADLARQTALIAAIVLAFVTALAVLWFASGAIVVVLVGIVIAVMFDAGARGLGRLVGWRRSIRLILVYVTATLVVTVAAVWGGATLATQAGQLTSAVRNALARIGRELADGGIGILPEGSIEISQFLPSAATVFGGATAAFTSVFGGLVTIGVVIFLGAFLTWSPAAYKAAVLSIIPHDKRHRVNEVLDLAAAAMREWLVGQCISMAVIFVFSLVALKSIGMPYATLLAVQAGLLVFVPTLGAFVAGIVIVLAGFSDSPTMALYGLGVYLAIQFLEGNLVTPIVQQQTVRLPPAITLAMQLIVGLLFGLLGVAFVVPLTAAAKVLIEELYVKDALGGPWREDDEKSAVTPAALRQIGRPP